MNMALARILKLPPVLERVPIQMVYNGPNLPINGRKW